MARMQWNTINKDALETLGNFAVAVWELGDKKAVFAKNHKARKTVLESDRTNLDKLNRGESANIIKTKEEIEESIAKQESDINMYLKAEQKLEQEIKDRMKKAYALVSDAQVEAYKNRLEKPEVYDTEITCFLKSIGVEPTKAGICVLRDTVGDKETNGKKVVKDAESVGLANYKDEPYRRMFLKGVCREMVKSGCLKTDRYAFEFKVENN